MDDQQREIERLSQELTEARSRLSAIEAAEHQRTQMLDELRRSEEALKASEQTFKEGGRIALPVFYQQAGEDRLISPERSKEFYDSIASKDKTFRMYEGLYHELHEEPEKDMVLEEMYGWLQKRLPS